jgi:hypothetical protein
MLMISQGDGHDIATQFARAHCGCDLNSTQWSSQGSSTFSAIDIDFVSLDMLTST